MEIIAIPIIKINSEEGDSHKNGTYGYSLGYIETETNNLHAILYEDFKLPIMTIDTKLELQNEKLEIKLTKHQKIYLEQLKKLKIKWHTK